MKKEMYLLLALLTITVLNYCCILVVNPTPPYDLMLKISSVAIAILWLYYLPDFLRESNSNSIIICLSIVMTFAATMFGCRYAAWDSYGWWIIGFGLALIFTSASIGALFYRSHVSRKGNLIMIFLFGCTVFNYYIYNHQPVDAFWYFSFFAFTIIAGVVAVYYQPYLLEEFKDDKLFESLIILVTMGAALLACRCVVCIFSHHTVWGWWFPSVAIGFSIVMLSYGIYRLDTHYKNSESEEVE